MSPSQIATMSYGSSRATGVSARAPSRAWAKVRPGSGLTRRPRSDALTRYSLPKSSSIAPRHPAQRWPSRARCQDARERRTRRRSRRTGAGTTDLARGAFLRLPLLDTERGSKLREVEGTRKEVIQIDASSSSRGYLLGEVALT